MDRQKKILIIVGAWISAALLSWFVYAKTVAPQSEPMKALVVAAHDMPLGTLLRDKDVKLVKYPERDVPKGAIFEVGQAKDRVILVPMYGNEPVLVSKLSAPTATEGVSSTIRRGYRAVSVPITDANGVAGLVLPNSHVDVMFTRPGNMAEATTSTILRNVTVLSVGHQSPSGQTVEKGTTRQPVVTLVLTPADAQKVELAKNQGRISLSLRNPLDDDDRGAPPGGTITTEALDPNINARMALAKKGRVGGKSALEDPALWQELTGAKKQVEEKKKEPEKPRAVIDVYRGDKHVQELFK
jgi:pilus assembly protein CpaB